MQYVTIIKSHDISDSITELTEAIGYFLTFLLIIGFIIYQIFKYYALKDQKGSSITSTSNTEIVKTEEKESKNIESKRLTGELSFLNYDIISTLYSEFEYVFGEYGLNYKNFKIRITKDSMNYLIPSIYLSPWEYMIFINHKQSNVKIYIKETESRFKYIGKNIITTKGYYEECIKSKKNIIRIRKLKWADC